jgi:dipeptidyl aminopeptidase/acylaminoacyl peptidase
MLRFLTKGLLTALLFGAAMEGEVLSQTTVTPIQLIPPKIPVEEFARLPFMHNPKLSPDGTKILTQLNLKGKEKLGILSLFDAAVKPTIIPQTEKQAIRGYRWLTDKKILISIAFKLGTIGNEFWVSRLVTYELDSGNYQFVGSKSKAIVGDDVLFVAEDASFLLLAVQKTVYDYPAVLRVDLITGVSTQVVKPKDDIWDWYADFNGIVRFGIRHSGSGTKVFYRSAETDDFKPISSQKFEDDTADYDRFTVLTGQDAGLVMSNVKTGRWGLYAYDPKYGEVGKAIYENSEYDVEDFTLSDDGRSVENITYSDDRQRTVWFTDYMQKTQYLLDKALPNSVNRIVSLTKDRTRSLVLSARADDPGSYFYFDRVKGKLLRIAGVLDQFDGVKLAPVTYVKYKARDDLTIHAYLTLPVGRSATNLPTIIMPHGGPFLRDTWQYDEWAQMLANRGYAVFQPNYRGSTGYGKSFLEKGYGEFGRGMQNDVLDGLQWLVDQKIADPKRVCIVGGSYGGYAALLGATQTPDLFKCAVSFAGISNVDDQLFFQSGLIREKGYQRWSKIVLGKESNLKAVSPIRLVDQMSIPLLMAHGTEDPRVPFLQSELMVKALRSAGKQVEWLAFKDQGHGFDNETDKLTFLKAMDTFLAKYNPAN